MDQKQTPTDFQVGGDHYREMKIQPTEFIHSNGIGFIEGNIIKYLCRHRMKNGKQDLEKAAHYLQMLIAMEYPEKFESKPEADDDEWIPWGGGECPTGKSVFVRLRNGYTSHARSTGYRWAHDNNGSDIIAYKIAIA